MPNRLPMECPYRTRTTTTVTFVLSTKAREDWADAMLRVLVIDDDRELCQLVSVCLLREGMNVQVAHDGRSGLNLALSGQYDLAIWM
jgi:PleD family two-component response regulator